MHLLTRSLSACSLAWALGHAGLAAAQAPAPAAQAVQEPGTQPSRQNQTIERIRTEDAGSRIDELRVGGRTQAITVQPKNDMPAYEVRPVDAQGGSGMRVWNFKQF